MPVVRANINRINAAENSKFIPISHNHKDYVRDLRSTYHVSKGGSDHFISTFNDVDDLTLLYGNDPVKLPQVMQEIENNPILRNWISAVFCAMMFGFDGTNKLSIINLPYENLDVATGQITPVPNTAYLKVWKEKFDFNGIKTNDKDNTYTVNGVNRPFINEHSLNVISFSNAFSYPDLLGCYSEKYFVIPLKEYKLNQYDIIPSWKKKYFELSNENNNFIKSVNNLNVRQKVLLYLSASSIPATAPEPIKLAKDIILRYVNVANYGVVFPGGINIPSYETRCNIQFYKTNNVLDLDNLLSKKIFIGIDLVGTNMEYRATYPITEELIKALKNRNSNVQQIRFEVDADENDSRMINSATFSFNFSDELLFVAAAAPVGGVINNNVIRYTYNVSKTYLLDDIVNIVQLQTMCMFPNISTEYEHECSEYTYLSLDQTFLCTIAMNGAKSVVNLKEGVFKGDITGNGTESVIIQKVSQFSRDTPNGKIYKRKATVPEHFIQVCDVAGNCCGYALNIRSNNTDAPALLTSSFAGTYSISLPERRDLTNTRFYAYVDFGSSSSCMKFKKAAGNYLTDSNGVATTVTEQCIVRMFLADYFKDDYKLIMNIPDENNHYKFMSISTIYDDTLGASDCSVYSDGWMPVIKNLSGYEPIIKVTPSRKTTIVNSGGDSSPNIIINNLCYTIACNAISNGCKELYIVPSLPNNSYLNNLTMIWNSARDKMNIMFPNIEIRNALISNDTQFLLESVAVSNGIIAPANGCMRVSVDMGDGTTDMSAILTDINSNQIMCGQSSIEYAGKNLIKTVVKDIIEHTASRSEAENMLIGSVNYGNPLFTTYGHNPQDKNEYSLKISNLLNVFYQGNMLVHNTADDDAWENKVMDILAISNLGSGIDQKVAANLILRYAILMPVVRDFIKTAIKLAGSNFDNNTTIEIDFVGGSAKGVQLLNVVDSLRGTKAGDIVQNYFIKEFPNNMVSVVGVAPVVGMDGKDLLIDGLNSLTISPAATVPGGVVISHGEPPAVPINAPKWGDINPDKKDDLGDSVHQGALLVPFTSVAQEGETGISTAKNIKVIYSPASYYENYENDRNAALNDFVSYFENEIYSKLINDGDGNPDVIETLIVGFVKNASPAMKSSILREITNLAANNSFYKATHSSIYPEMIKSTIFMFAISKLLSEFHRGYRSDHPINNGMDVNGYQFGG